MQNQVKPSQDNRPSRRLVKIRKVADMLDSSTMTVTRLEKEGDLPPHFYLGRERVWYEDEILDWIEHKRLTSVPRPRPVFQKGVPQSRPQPASGRASHENSSEDHGVAVESEGQVKATG